MSQVPATGVTCQRPGCARAWPRDPVLEVKCPTCGAAVGQRCRRGSEHRVFGGEPHAERDRLADRLGKYGPCPLGVCGLTKRAAAAERRSPVPTRKTTRRPAKARRPAAPRPRQAATAAAAIDAALLARAGRALFGSRWQKELGQAIGKSERYVHFMAAGERPVSAPVAELLRDLVAKRRAELEELAGELAGT